MPKLHRIALAAIGLFAGCGPVERSIASPITIDFEAPAMAVATADMQGDLFAAQGVTFRTVRLSGTVAAGAVVTLAPIADGLRLYRDAGAISGQQSAGPALGGGYNDLLMRFDRPVRSVSLTSDDMVESANPIRLIALEATDTSDRFRVVDFVDALDDAVASPQNLLALAPADSFSFALFEVRTQQEAFDDLGFAFAAVTPVPMEPVQQPGGGTTPNPSRPGGTDIPAPSSLAMLAGMLGGVAAARRGAGKASHGPLPGTRRAGSLRARAAWRRPRPSARSSTT
jgi:hypothetical protein